MLNARKNTQSLLINTILLCSPLGASALELSSPELSEFSLEGLMQVTIASKTPRSLKEIPATVRVYTAEDIKKHGWLYLSEVLRDVPGVDVSDTGSGTFYTTRGVADASAHGNKTVIMINGHNIGFPSLNSPNFLGLQKDINLASKRQVEILVGPGSTLHGANAFGMVVDLITYDPEDVKGVTANISYGSNQEAVGSLTGSFGKGKWSGLVSGTYIDQRKSNLSEVKISSTPGVEEYDNSQFEDNFQNNYAMDGYVDYDRQIRFGFNVMHNDSGHGTVFLSTEVGRRVFDKKMLFMDINRKITGNLEYKLRSHYLIVEADSDKIRQEFTGSSNTRGSSNVDSESITLDNQLIYTINDKNTVLTGLFAERSRQRPVKGAQVNTGEPIKIPTALPAQNWDNYALFLQWEWKPVKQIYGVLGLRYVDSIKQYDSTTLPHIGFIYSITPNNLVKFNYQRGYRPISAFEKGSSAPHILTNPDLKPEYNDNYEVSLVNKLWKTHELTTTFFYSDVINLIKRVDTGNLVPNTTNHILTDENVASMHIKGMEIGVVSELTETFHAKAVATYTNSHDSSTDYDTEPVVPYKLNLSLNWKLQSNVFLIVDNYWRVHPTTSKKNTVFKGQDAPNWLLSNINLRTENVASFKRLTMNFTVRNFLNEEYGMIDRRGGIVDLVPGVQPGEQINVILSIEYQTK